MPWCKCGHYITLTQASLSSRRNDSHEPACKDCVTKELTEAKKALDELDVQDGGWDIGKSNAANDAYWRKVHFPELEKQRGLTLEEKRLHDAATVPGYDPTRDGVRCDHKFVDSVHCLKCGWRP